MTISYNWLIDYLPGQHHSSIPNPEQLSKILTAIGLEVESLEKYEEITGSLKGLVIGEILEVKDHPNADRLKLTQVDVGTKDPLQIVCGAPNVYEKQKVVVAPVGVTIHPIEDKPFTLKKAKIRGEVSFGMMCAEDEIGLGTNHKGIIELDTKAKPGTKASDYFQPTQDWIYEIGLTPNRMDAMSHLGVARDVCAKLSYDTEKKWQSQPVSVNAFKADNDSKPVKVSIENEKACPRYTGLSLANIKVEESPKWLRQRLQAVGVRPINNVVDITNYVLHECGQPLHAFDLDAVKGLQIKVKNLPEGTPFVTLDKETRKLRKDDLMICNAEDPMCIAGIFGGRDSGVTEDTTSIFLESACFNAVTTRRSSFYHDLRTDAATRFEKGVDISGVTYALKRAAMLMVDLCDARIVSDIVDRYPQPQDKTKIHLKRSYLNKLSGKDYSLEQAVHILTDLGFDLINQSGEDIHVAVPFNKPDMSVPADLVEEIMRIDGYDNVDLPTHIKLSPSTKETALETTKEKIAHYLSGNGFHEILNNSISNSAYYEGDRPMIKLMNSLSSELDVMRPSLLETGLETVAYNLHHNQKNILFFEIGKVYAPQGKREKELLALWASGDKRPNSWLQKSDPIDLYFLKGHLENLFSRLGISDALLNYVPEENNYLQNNLEIKINKKSVGRLGQVSGGKLNSFDIRQQTWYAELDLSSVKRNFPPKGITYQPVPKYPGVQRDLSLVIDRKVKYAEVENVANGIKTRILEEIKLFDVFEGETLGKNKKSYAVSFIFRHPKRTLTDKEIDKVMDRLIQSFEKQLGAEWTINHHTILCLK